MEISIVTSNISADFLRPPGVPSWDERRQTYVDVLFQANPDIIGLQEVTPRQLQFLQTQLSQFAALTVPVSNPTEELKAAWQAKYEEVGLPQIPSPYEIILFYRIDALNVISTGHWWLSPTPDVPSIGFGNIAPRVVLWAQVRHKASAREFVLFNTHIDHRSPHPMIGLCRKNFEVFAEKHASLIFMGDFNLNEKDSSYDLLIADGWRDSFQASPGGDSATFLYNLPGKPV